MVMLIIMTGIAFTYATVGNATRTSETRREQAVIARLAFDGATLKAAYDAGLGNVTYPSTQAETVGNYVCSVTINDNSANLSHSLSLTSTMSQLGRTYSDSRVTALKMPFSPFFYCLATDTNTGFGNSITTGSGGTNGDIYCAGNLWLSPTDDVNGDVEATGTATQGTGTVTGLTSSNVVPLPYPTPVASNYSAVASSSLLGILLGIVLSGEVYTTPYMVVYCTGNTSIRGTFTGKGIIFVDGNVTVNGNMSYLLPTDEAHRDHRSGQCHGQEQQYDARRILVLQRRV